MVESEGGALFEDHLPSNTQSFQVSFSNPINDEILFGREFSREVGPGGVHIVRQKFSLRAPTSQFPLVSVNPLQRSLSNKGLRLEPCVAFKSGTCFGAFVFV